MQDLKVENGDWIIEHGKPQEIEGHAVIEQRLLRRMRLYLGELFYDPAFGSTLNDALHGENFQSELNQLQTTLERDKAVKEADVVLISEIPFKLNAEITLISGDKLQTTLSL